MTRPEHCIGILRANEKIGPGLYLMTIEAPSIAETVSAGQFTHVLIPGMEAHILRRPFSIYRASTSSGEIEILYQVVGYGTELMTKLSEGTALDLLGPIGKSWTVPESAKRALLIAGGVGAAPLYMLAEELNENKGAFDVILGAQTKNALVCHDRYSTLVEHSSSASLRCSTDDGSFGFAGFCIPLVEEALKTTRYDYLAVCGPEPLMKKVATLANKAGIYSEASFERRMACGIGACLSCVVDTKRGKKRACVDGPVFNLDEVVFS